MKAPRSAGRHTSAWPTADDHQVAVNRRRESSGTGIHHVPSYNIIRSCTASLMIHSRQPARIAAARLGHMANSSPRPHHTGPAIAASVARQAVRRVQADTVGVQGDPRSLTTVPRSDCRLITAAGRRHLRSSINQSINQSTFVKRHKSRANRRRVKKKARPGGYRMLWQKVPSLKHV